MNPELEPPVTKYSPLFELRAWRRELGRLQLLYADDAAALSLIAKMRSDAECWIEANLKR